MSLPPPGTDQAYCSVSALEAGSLTINVNYFVEGVASEVLEVPSLAFLLRHSKTNDAFVFDLGLRRDHESHTPAVRQALRTNTSVRVDQDVAQSLAKGGLSPSEVTTVALSHCHFDHTGDPRAFPRATFLLGAGSASLLAAGYPGDPQAWYAADLVPAERTCFLAPEEWTPVGPFAHGLDWYGDGSLYIVDAPGHLPGHINILARTSADGAWVHLAGDSAHDWSLITGAGRVAFSGPLGCMHADRAVAEDTIVRIRALWETPRVRVLLAHDEPWYKENKRGAAFWPGHIESL